MSTFVQRLWDKARNRERGMHPGDAVVNRRDLIELLNHFERLDGEVRKHHAVKQMQLQDSAPLLHWYCFTYVGSTIEGRSGATACTYAGLEKEKITLEIIKQQKKEAGMMDGSVLISCIYLGCMAKDVFVGETTSETNER